MTTNGNNLRIILTALVTAFVFIAGLAVAQSHKAEALAFNNGKDIAVLQSQFDRIEDDLKEIKELIRNK